MRLYDSPHPTVSLKRLSEERFVIKVRDVSRVLWNSERRSFPSDRLMHLTCKAAIQRYRLARSFKRLVVGTIDQVREGLVQKQVPAKILPDSQPTVDVISTLSGGAFFVMSPVIWRRLRKGTPGEIQGR